MAEACWICPTCRKVHGMPATSPVACYFSVGLCQTCGRSTMRGERLEYHPLPPGVGRYHHIPKDVASELEELF